MIPRIIHMLYIPWGPDQRMLPDTERFDRSPAERMTRYAPGWEVRVWSYRALVELLRAREPALLHELEANATRPVMWVDVLRWFVVHHFGGIYWQMNTTPLRAMDAYLPSAGKNVRLFTEFELTPEQRRAAVSEPIRAGEPEEAKRILIQAFAAAPGAPFVAHVLGLQRERMAAHRPKRDYDILFITGNAMASTAYDHFGRNDPGVEVTDLAASRAMIKWHYRGTWRTDAAPARSASATTVQPRRVAWWKPVVKNVVRQVRPDAYERVADRMLLERSRTSCLPALRAIDDLPSVASVYEMPSGMIDGHPAGPRVRYIGADPSRAVVRNNRRAVRPHPGIRPRFRFVHPLHARVPRSELVISAGLLEWLPFAEALLALHELKRGCSGYLALTHHPLLAEVWDTALGDDRPINLMLAPFSLPEPWRTVAFPDPQGRPDRVLAVWRIQDLPRNR